MKIFLRNFCLTEFIDFYENLTLRNMASYSELNVQYQLNSYNKLPRFIIPLLSKVKFLLHNRNFDK